MVSAVEAGALAPIPTAELAGGLHAALDLRVDPRRAVAALTGLLEEDEDAHVEWETTVLEIEPGGVHADSITVQAPRIVICPGPDYAALPVACRDGMGPLTLCTLQMLRLSAPGGRRYAPTLATGLSIIRYPAFTAQPGAASVRERLVAERPELVEAGIHLLVAQLPEGDLVVGETRTSTERRRRRFATSVSTSS